MAIDIDDLEALLENENVAENAANKKVVELTINGNLLKIIIIRELQEANKLLRQIRNAVRDD